MEKMNTFVKGLDYYRQYLTKQQIKTLKGQALSGNILGAQKGLIKILNKADLKVK